MPYKSKTYSSRRFGGNYHGGGASSYSSSGRSRSSGGSKGPKKDYIDPARFVKVAQPTEAMEYTPLHEFVDFDVNLLIKANLDAKGYKTPTPIQDKTIPAALAGRDIIGIADTGTGKTAAFAIPLLQAMMLGDARALVIAPTRELAQQIDAEFRWIAKGSNLKGATLIGGAGIGPQLRDLRANPQIVIGTPGRIKDHLERGSLRLDNFTFVVLDEVDRMLDMGFVNDVRNILNRVSAKRQSFFFSATMDPKVNALIETFASDPITISIKTGDTGENIHQDVVRVGHDSEKMDKLHDLLISGELRKVIIFDDTQRSVERLSKELISRGFSADAIHGGKTQGARQRSLKKFKDNEVKILVATDVAARGIDVAGITHVINYSTPKSYADYVHRIGRAGRAGKIGYALTFITQ
ncbi:MAG TPA: DEAD/DEAH box helicase [Candidatus Saccharimonadales bacterium]|jgi:superfamily II DNA/RNA helicase|nr:DEAD/DEAH box helicase [Candidatus Saccharimonadales bacterium]